MIVHRVEGQLQLNLDLNYKIKILELAQVEQADLILVMEKHAQRMGWSMEVVCHYFIQISY